MKNNQKKKFERAQKLEAQKAIASFYPKFMVWVDGGYAPAKRHVELGDACAEAERLCRKENRQVFVLADAYVCSPPAQQPVTWMASNSKLPIKNHKK